ncbi:hypothetical protein [Luteimonas vadosa]|uniref:Uncharacterized protein n=1 Tax=Luteimonas vadosa TaxID=1165507 RepID=A0ABP9DQR0_9GAMM
MKKREKPDFSLSEAGYWIDPSVIPEAERSLLLRFLSDSSLDGDAESGRRARFLKFAMVLVTEPRHGDTPALEERAQLTAIIHSIGGDKGILGALENLSESNIEHLAAFAREVGYDDPPVISEEAAIQLRDRHGLSDFLEDLWNRLQVLACVTERANDNLQVGRTVKRAQDRARALVSRLADYHFELCGSWPPSNNASWFSNFAGKLGELVGAELGLGTLRSGLLEAKSKRNFVDVQKEKIKRGSSKQPVR